MHTPPHTHAHMHIIHTHTYIERHVNTGNVMRAIETKLSTHYESQ